MAEAPLEELVVAAQGGDHQALEGVLAAIQPKIHALALRFLWDPHDAEDATQEVLLRIATRIVDFEGRSAFTTWAYRIATRILLDHRPTELERRSLSFEAMGEELARDSSRDAWREPPGVDEALLLEEVKIGCTHAMLHCLPRDQRIAFILGEILELDHREAAAVVEISPTAFRQRLSRARKALTLFLAGHCGLFDPANPCRCRRRLQAAVRNGHLTPDRLRFAFSAAQAKRFPSVLAEVRRLDAARRTAALYRSHPDPRVRDDLVPALRRLLESPSGSAVA